MRVLHLYAGNLFGGIETLLVTISRCRGLCPNVDSHFALCFEGRLSAELGAAKVPVYMLGAARVSRPWTVWRARARLQRLLADLRPDLAVCHSAWPHALFAPVVRAAGVTLVYWAHDVHSGWHWLEYFGRQTVPQFAIANSRFTQAALANVFPDVPSEVVRCPVCPQPSMDRESTRQQVRAELGTPNDATVILQVSRMERYKGHAHLIEALSRLADRGGWRCWIAGGNQRPSEKRYLSQLRARADALGIGERVRFLGQRADVPRLLAAADIFCQPNTGPEPFGIAFVEALYAGLPVVTTKIGGAVEIVDDECGVLVAPGDVSSLEVALRGLIFDRTSRLRLGNAGPGRAARLCDPHKQLCKLQELFARVLSDRGYHEHVNCRVEVPFG